MEKLNQCEENLLSIMENINALNQSRLTKLIPNENGEINGGTNIIDSQN